MLRVKVYEVDEHGEEKLCLDNEGNPIVLDGDGLLMIMQTANKTDEGNTLEVNGSVFMRGKINKIAMGNIINSNKEIRRCIVADRMNEMIGRYMDDVENEGNDEDGVTE